MSKFDYLLTIECLIGVLPLINLVIFFKLPPFPSPINYWGKFPTLTNFLKQYTYAEVFEISHKQRSVFKFV